MNRMDYFKKGMEEGMPVCLGYAAVSFSLGIAMKNAGIDPVQGFFMSMLNLASAGEYAGLRVITSGGSYLQMALMTFVANARYLLMSCAFSQKYTEDIPVIHRYFNGMAITDELFALGIRQNPFDPFYYYGTMAVSVPGWSIGTSIGIIAGNILPPLLVNALSVALYGMFLAIIIPPCRKDLSIRYVVISGFVSSYLAFRFLSFIPEGTRIIILTVVLSAAASVLRPLKEEEYDT